jgi:Protein of unknown function (DUF3987)
MESAREITNETTAVSVTPDITTWKLRAYDLAVELIAKASKGGSARLLAGFAPGDLVESLVSDLKAKCEARHPRILPIPELSDSELEEEIFNVAAAAVGKFEGTNQSKDDQSNREPPPQPLSREVPAGEPFPTEALPGLLGEIVDAVQERTQAPRPLSGQSVLATTALIVQGFGDVELPTGAVRPCSEYFGTIAATGERKTSAEDLVSAAIREREAELDVDYRAAFCQYESRLAAWERQRHQVLSNRKSNPDLSSKERALAELGPAPSLPLSPLLVVSEPTFEGLTRFIKDGQASVGIFSTEGGQFIGGHAMNEENRLKTAAGLSRLWDDGEARRSRQGEGTFIIKGHRVSIHLQVQPDAAARFFADPVLHDQGLLSRFLTSWPESAVGYRKWHEPSPRSAAVLNQYQQRALAILRSPLPLDGARKNELKPRVLKLSPGAREVWRTFYDYCETNLTPGGPLEPVTGLANKAPEHAARLATILTLFGNLDAREIDKAMMVSGVTLARFYLTEAIRIVSLTRTDPDIQLAHRLLTWLHDSWKEPRRLVSLPDIYQRSLNAIGDKSTAARIVDILCGHGWLRQVSPTEVNGVRRQQVWRIVE